MRYLSVSMFRKKNQMVVVFAFAKNKTKKAESFANFPTEGDESFRKSYLTVPCAAL